MSFSHWFVDEKRGVWTNPFNNRWWYVVYQTGPSIFTKRTLLGAWEWLTLIWLLLSNMNGLWIPFHIWEVIPNPIDQLHHFSRRAHHASNIFYFPFQIWDVIPTPLTNSIIFQDGHSQQPPTSDRLCVNPKMWKLKSVLFQPKFGFTLW